MNSSWRFMLWKLLRFAALPLFVLSHLDTMISRFGFRRTILAFKANKATINWFGVLFVKEDDV